MAMTNLTNQIEAMRIRMKELSGEELGLVSALGDALDRADQKLMEEVRNLTVAHEARRGAILAELQALAVRLGAFPRRLDPFGVAENASRDRPPIEPPHPDLARGDWRRANMQDELALHLSGRAIAN
jgi:hypothetical protein